MYDDARNRLTKTTTSGETVVVTNYTYDNENHLTQSVTGNATTYYGYDNNGNQVSQWTRIANVSESTDGVNLGLQSEATDDLLTLYEYDVFDRLIKIEQGDDVIENTYTADGKKFSRKINALLVYYVYDGDVVLEERTEINAEMARNVYGRNLIFRETRADSGYYSYNGHGDVVRWEYANRNGYVEYEYDEFGQVSSYEYAISTMAPVMAPTIDTTDEVSPKELGYVCNPYRYAGYEYLEQIGIYDLNARYYNPEIARFLSQDPYYDLGNRVIGLYEINVPNAWSIVQANNIYVYCGNSPIIFLDYTGLEKIVISGGVTSNDYSESGPYEMFKYEFIETALKAIVNHVTWEINTSVNSYGTYEKEDITWIIMNYNYSEEDLKSFSETAEHWGVNMVVVNQKQDFVNYINSKNVENNELTDARKNDPISSVDVFSHGLKGYLAFGYNSSSSATYAQGQEINFHTNDIDLLESDAFDNTYTRFYSCNTGSVKGDTSFAQAWSNKTNGKSMAVVNDTTNYVKINASGFNIFKLWDKWNAKDSRKQNGYSLQGSVNYPEPSETKWVTFSPKS